MNWREKAARTLADNSREGFVSFVSSPPAPFSPEADYTAADLAEMDRLIDQLAELEAWTDDELAKALDQRQRMAPCRVLSVLEQLREWTARQLAPWPEKPTQRAAITICEF